MARAEGLAAKDKISQTSRYISHRNGSQLFVEAAFLPDIRGQQAALTFTGVASRYGATDD